MANWDKIQSSGDVEDRRGDSRGVATGVGGIGAILLMGAVLFFGGNGNIDPQQVQNLLDQLQQTQGQTTTTNGEFEDIKKYKEFAQKVIGSNNEVWTKELAKQNIQYKEPRLVLFRGVTKSACGGATSQVGPHYCPTDKTVYLDETFFEELTTKFGAKGGDVAEAYVMAHEIGHHIQNVRGTFGKFDTSDNKTSVKVELQADCYAGVWAGDVSSEGVISEVEIDQAIDAAGSVGDDRIQKSQGGNVNPETWTHGSSAERKKWFLTGYKTKDAKSCSTIS
jgi:predicted metalloprotease